MHADVFDAIANGLYMTGVGRDAAKDFLTAEVGTLSAAAKRHGISRPAVARQVKRVQAAAGVGPVEVTLTLSLAELEAIFAQRQEGYHHPTLPPETIVSRAERMLQESLTVARPSTKGASFYSSNDLLFVVDRQRSSAIHAWISQTKQSRSFKHAEIEFLSTKLDAAETKPPAFESLCKQGLVTEDNEGWAYLRIHSLNALEGLISDFVMN